MKAKRNTNKIERYHSTFRERNKVMRGFKAKHTAQGLSDGFRVYYNFIRKHQGLGDLLLSILANINIPPEEIDV